MRCPEEILEENLVENLYSGLKTSAGYGNKRLFEIFYNASKLRLNIPDSPPNNSLEFSVEDILLVVRTAKGRNFGTPRDTLFSQLALGYDSPFSEQEEKIFREHWRDAILNDNFPNNQWFISQKENMLDALGSIHEDSSRYLDVAEFMMQQNMSIHEDVLIRLEETLREGDPLREFILGHHRAGRIALKDDSHLNHD